MMIRLYFIFTLCGSLVAQNHHNLHGVPSEDTMMPGISMVEPEDDPILGMPLTSTDLDEDNDSPPTAPIIRINSRGPLDKDSPGNVTPLGSRAFTNAMSTREKEGKDLDVFRKNDTIDGSNTTNENEKTNSNSSVLTDVIPVTEEGFNSHQIPPNTANNDHGTATTFVPTNHSNAYTEIPTTLPNAEETAENIESDTSTKTTTKSIYSTTSSHTTNLPHYHAFEEFNAPKDHGKL